MKRFANQPLPSESRIAVVTNDAIGNFVVATPLLAMLRRARSPRVLDYFGGERVQELAERSDLVDRSVPVLGMEPREFAASLGEPYDLVVNLEHSPWAMAVAALLAGREGWVCGPCVGEGGRGRLPFPNDERGELWADPNWIAEDLRERYAFLDSSWIAEIFCRASYLEGPVPPYSLPIEPAEHECQLLISASASLPEKIWPFERWREALERVGLRAGLVGAPPGPKSRFWLGGQLEQRLVDEGHVQDLRGRWSLPGVVGALSQARAVLTIDNGILHLAASTGTPTVGIFRHGIHRLWAPPSESLEVVEPGVGRGVDQIEVETVVRALETALLAQ